MTDWKPLNKGLYSAIHALRWRYRRRASPIAYVKISATKSLLNTALVILLAILASPQPVSNNVAAKDDLVSGIAHSIVGIQNTYPGYPEGDNSDINRAPEWVSTLSQNNTFTRLHISAPAPDVAFTVSQARAPPQC